MPERTYLQGPCVWMGTQIQQDPRWLKPIPAVVLDQLDVALDGVKNVHWRDVTRHNFPLPDAAAFFNEVREELESGSGIVKICGLNPSRYDQEQLRRLWYGIGSHLGRPMYQNCR